MNKTSNDNAVADAIPFVERMIEKEETHLAFLKSKLIEAQHPKRWFIFLYQPSAENIQMLQYFIRKSERSLSHLKMRLLEYDLYRDNYLTLQLK